MATHFPLFFFIIPLLCSTSSAFKYTDLIFKGCGNQKFQDPSGSSAKTLKTLYDTLNSQSENTNFSKITVAGDGGKDAILGLYQCRGDLSGVDCHNCVSQFPKLARKLCGDAVAMRVQLVGCYMRYETVGFRQVASREMLYKYCKGAQASGFDQKRDGAFEEVASGVANGGGFYAASYDSVYAMGQCEGDLEASECGGCVKTALERVKVECGETVSGQVYLNQCYVSYTYYPNGVGDASNVRMTSTSSQGTKHHTAKTVAIVAGVTAAAGFGVVILLWTKSMLKKRKNNNTAPKYYYEYGG